MKGKLADTKIYRDDKIEVHVDSRNWVLKFLDGGAQYYFNDFDAFLKGLLKKEAKRSTKQVKEIVELRYILREIQDYISTLPSATIEFLKETIIEQEQEIKRLNKKLGITNSIHDKKCATIGQPLNI